MLIKIHACMNFYQHLFGNLETINLLFILLLTRTSLLASVTLLARPIPLQKKEHALDALEYCESGYSP